MAKRQADLWEYRDRNLEQGNTKDDFYYITAVPATIAKKLLTGQPNINPDDGQNDSAPAKDLVSWAQKYHGFVGGFVIPVASKREDARIGLDTLYLPVAFKAAVTQLKNKTKPDEFSEVTINGKKYMRFWWD